jgi:hypothetical protein
VPCGMARSWKKSFICDSALCHSVKFKSNIFLPTPHYAAQRGGDSVLCCIARNQHIFATICRTILTRWSVTQVGLINEKTEGQKSRETVPLGSKWHPGTKLIISFFVLQYLGWLTFGSGIMTPKIGWIVILILTFF